MSEKERDAFIEYTGDGYSWINRFLCGGIEELSEKSLEKIENLCSAQEKGECPENVVVWRGTTNWSLYGEFERAGPKTCIGRVLQEDAFVSTSLSENRAFGGNVKFKIFVPKGVRCGSGYWGQVPSELELLL